MGRPQKIGGGLLACAVATVTAYDSARSSVPKPPDPAPMWRVLEWIVTGNDWVAIATAILAAISAGWSIWQMFQAPSATRSDVGEIVAKDGALTRDTLAKLKAAEDRRNGFKLGASQVFFSPQVAQQGGVRESFKSFYFGEQADGFLGRAAVLAAIRERLLAPDPDRPFRWAAICGDAGTGKSRLALHLLQSEVAGWPLSGFVRAGFVRNADQAMTDLSGISGPTLFVVDYAGGSPEACCTFLERCAQLAGDAPYPIRALVLVRRSDDRFFDLIRDGIDDAAAINSQLRFSSAEGGDDFSGAWQLEGLGDADTRALMAERIARVGADTGTAIGVDEDLLALLDDYDETRRPLFALIVAEMLAHGLVRVRHTRHTGTSREEAQLRLLWDYLAHQHVRWRKHRVGDGGRDPDDDKDAIDRHLSFLILSTMCRGLADSDWQRLFDNQVLGEDAAALLPGHPDHPGRAAARGVPLLDEKNLLAALSGAVRSGKQALYPILEPDLVGESLVLMAFHARGDEICSSDIVAEQRRLFLRRFGWCADPAGMAFFTVLVAQDFPEHAAQFHWLLDEENADNAPYRARLFRNLVRVTSGPLRTRAAAMADVARFEQLLADFPTDPAHDTDVQREHAAGVRDIAEQLVFIINKSRAPRIATDVAPLDDKQGRRDAFDQAARSTGRQAAPGDGQAIYDLHSDAETVARALVVLRGLCEVSIETALSAAGFALRKPHADIVASALNTVFWRDRESSEHGFAATPPDAEEIAARDRLAERVEQSLKVDPDGEVTVAVAAYLTSAIIYAEQGDDCTRGCIAFDAVRALSDIDGFTLADTLHAALRLIVNHSFNEAQSRLDRKVEGEAPPPLDDIVRVASALFRKAIGLTDLTEGLRRPIGTTWCDIVTRLAYYEGQCGRDPLPGLIEGQRLYADFIAAQGGVQVTRDTIDLFNALCGAQREAGCTDEDTLRDYAAHVRSHGFDTESLNDRSWTNLRYHWWLLCESQPAVRADISNLAVAACDQIGERAAGELAAALADWLPKAALDGEWIDELAGHALGWPNGGIASDRRAALRLALFAQRLINGRDDAVFADLERLWCDGEGGDLLSGQAEALACLRVLVGWYGVADARLATWRRRLLDLFAVPPGPMAHSEARRALNDAALAAATSFAQFEIALGGEPDDWLLVERYT